LNVAIIGAGAVAAHHAQAAAELPGARLTGVSSRRFEQAEALARRFNARAYRQVAEVFGDAEVDLVIICTLPDSHGALVLEAAKSGKHVLVEKPMDITLEGAERSIQECRGAGVTLAVVSQKRFTDGARFLHRSIRDGVFGRLLQVDASMKWYREPSYYARQGKGCWDVEGGGALMNQAIHQIDLLRWLAGPVARVRCEWQLGAFHEIESEDIACAMIRYGNGATGVLQASTCFYPGYPDRLEIHGTRGSAITQGDFLKDWSIKDAPEPSPELFQESTVGSSQPMSISVEPFRRQLANVRESILEGSVPLVSGEEGMETLRLVLAMYQSAREQRDIPLEGGTPERSAFASQ
jgi:UDP-N-acetyl-2-amino-2-deoxyglucuronate dehydrogenase